ncbi:FAD-dependent monooxygenase [Ramlibacter sp. PS4R-6]|uniref:FAD-dependent monooxygenase n=1 Tax=Ramlibacter sp. PS4R-6 TaxID=3133438 RepID=UPI0030999A99
MPIELTIAGGGIAGLAAAFASARAGMEARVFERAPQFSETGAGIQLGPNVTRILEAWSLGAALRACAAAPEALVVRDAADGRELARMPLGRDFEQRYGAPYLTLHRADLQHLLLDAAREAGVDLHVDAAVAEVAMDARVRMQLSNGQSVEADALAAADGVWSTLRRLVADDGPAQATGHFAYRALALQPCLPPALRSVEVTVWLAPRMHVVAYPVRGGEQLNVVALLERASQVPAQGWDAVGAESDLLPAMHGMCCALHQLFDAMPGWGVWSLHDRPPVAGARELAKGRVALLGDAAHPMLPYLAQGAGMAIEDAQDLALVLADATPASVPGALQRYAEARWRRCALVQERARRNATIFHASGPLRFARDAAMLVAGQKLLDQPWLYAR